MTNTTERMETSKQEKMAALQMQFITHHNDRYGYVDGAMEALRGGCRWIQLRMKGATDEEVEKAAGRLMPACHEAGAVFLLDDRVELARRIGADGVHLGRNDMPVSQARTILGEEAIIGGTANTSDDIRRLAAEGADYIGCGPFRFTTTKDRLSPILGLDGYRAIVAQMECDGLRGPERHLPIVAIGGIVLDDVRDVMGTGVDGIALSGAILNATDPAAQTRCFLQSILGQQAARP